LEYFWKVDREELIFPCLLAYREILNFEINIFLNHIKKKHNLERD